MSTLSSSIGDDIMDSPDCITGLTLSINSSGSDNGSASQVFISEVEATDCDDMDYEEPRIPRKRKAC